MATVVDAVGGEESESGRGVIGLGAGTCANTVN